MKLSKAMEGFLLNMAAEGYSQSTMNLYKYLLSQMAKFLGDVEVSSIKPADLTRYFAYLRTEYIPHRKNGKTHSVSGSTMQKHWSCLRCFFKWAVDDLGLKKRPDTSLKLPSSNPKVIMPLKEDEVRKIIKEAKFTKEAKPGNRNAFVMKRRTAERDLALILLLLDTGLRVGECSRLNIADVDIKAGEVHVAPFGDSRRKTKSRIVYLGKAAKKAAWRYLASKEDCEPDEPLFVSERGRRMDANSIRLLLVDLGKKAGVNNLHPHRFRHTFAIEFLRGGGDVYSLQRLLGHSTLEMVQNYLAIADSDAANAHRKASPVDRWRL